MLALWVSIPTLAVGADDADGSSCANAIPVSGGMQLPIVRAGDVWFTAHTFDLPLTLVFTPSNQSTTQQPQAFFDFSCTPGEYDDPILNKYFNIHSSSYIPMPYQYPMERQVDDQGVLHFVLTVPVQFRDLLAKTGLTYNIQAYVRVYFPESGQSEISLDDQYSTCMSGGQIMKLGDKMDIAPNDSDSYAILPFGTFRMDSINYVWTGTTTATIYLMKDCSDLTQHMSEVMETWTMQPGEQKRLSMMEVRQKGNFYEACGTEGDLVYMHVISTSAGEIQVNRTEMAPPDNNAILLRYGEPVDADSTKLYFFPKTWENGVCFETSSRFITTAYFSANGHYTVQTPSDQLLSVAKFDSVANGHELNLSQKEIYNLTSKVSGNYVYVRFRSKDRHAQITPWEWNRENGSDCATISTETLPLGTRITLPWKDDRNNYIGTRVYRVRWSYIKDYDFKVISKLTRAGLTFYIATDCGTGYTKTNAKVLYHEQQTNNKTSTITAAKFAAIDVSKIPEDDYVYVCVKVTTTVNSGYFTISSTHPAEVDPEPEPEPECEKTIHAAVSAATPHGRVQIQFVNE